MRQTLSWASSTAREAGRGDEAWDGAPAEAGGKKREEGGEDEEEGEEELGE